MADIHETRETKVVSDAGGNVVERTERQIEPARRGGNFGGGALFGILIVAAAIAIFAYSQGSFRNAGADADRATVQARESAGAAAENAGAALETAGDNAKVAGENANREAQK